MDRRRTSDGSKNDAAESTWKDLHDDDDDDDDRSFVAVTTSIGLL